MWSTAVGSKPHPINKKNGWFGLAWLDWTGGVAALLCCWLFGGLVRVGCGGWWRWRGWWTLVGAGCCWLVVAVHCIRCLLLYHLLQCSREQQPVKWPSVETAAPSGLLARCTCALSVLGLARCSQLFREAGLLSARVFYLWCPFAPRWRRSWVQALPSRRTIRACASRSCSRPRSARIFDGV